MLAKHRGDDAACARIDRLASRLATTPGVYNHGRVGQDEIAQSYLRSQLWLYPTDFLETSCITAMEAQVAGCKIVATRCGALPETVPDARFVYGPTNESNYDYRFIEAVRETLEGLRPEGLRPEEEVCHVPTVRTWTSVALQWDVCIREANENEYL
jgi:glycosyltransferase involved in cell wall biosynthesis